MHRSVKDLHRVLAGLHRFLKVQIKNESESGKIAMTVSLSAETTL